MISLCGSTHPPALCMLLLMVCTLLLMVASLSAVPRGHGIAEVNGDLSCADDFALCNSFCYRYFGPDSKRPFHHAERYCARYRSSLVSIHSPHEEVFVVQLSENHTSFWIGLNDEDGPAAYHTEGVFKWTNGNTFTAVKSYQNWKEGEPNNRRHADCVKVDDRGWAMAQGGCAASRLPFVCKKQACPQGLEWGGAACDIVTNAGKIPQSHWNSPQCGLTITCLLVASVLISVLVCYHHRTRPSTTPHTLQNSKQYLTHGVLDILPT